MIISILHAIAHEEHIGAWLDVTQQMLKMIHVLERQMNVKKYKRRMKNKKSHDLLLINELCLQDGYFTHIPFL